MDTARSEIEPATRIDLPPPGSMVVKQDLRAFFSDEVGNDISGGGETNMPTVDKLQDRTVSYSLLLPT
jgi:hypothetical protein